MNRVLLVEDNAVNRRMVQLALRNSEFELIEAATGAEALRLAPSSQASVVLLDLVLPDTSGFDLIGRLRPLVGADCSFLAFTGMSAWSDESRLAAAGFDDVVFKPVEPARLRSVLQTHLPAPSIRRPGASRRVLVVDDDPVQRKLVGFRLSRLGFDVLGAADGEEALGLAQLHRPDAVVSDVLMPRMDGFELCARLRADAAFARTAIVLLTNSYLEESDRALAARVGASAYVVRTPDLNDMTAALERSLAGPAEVQREWGLHSDEVRSERNARAVRQLDRQVLLNSSLVQRTTMLAAELAILGGLTGALAEHHDVDQALDVVLGACFDASGIPWGVLLTRHQGAWSLREVGTPPPRPFSTGAQLAERLDLVARGQLPHVRPAREVLGPDQPGDLLVAPIFHNNEPTGALLMGDSRHEDHLLTFAGAIAGQIALVLTLAGAFRDLENATRAERARVRVLESILDSMRDPIVVYDQQMRPSHWNRAAGPLIEQLEGYPVRQWPERIGLYAADPPAHFDWSALPPVRALRGEAVDDAEMSVRKVGAGERWWSVTARPVLGDDSRVDGAVMVVRDVTEEKQSQARQIAADRLASVGVLAAGVAHEINNPLTSVVAELDMAIEDTAPDQPSWSNLLAARDAAGRVRTIVRDLKTLARGDADELGPVDLHRVIDTAVRMAAPQTRSCAEVALSLSPIPAVIASEPRLVQVLLNLLVNAAQAIGPGAPERNRIEVKASAAPEGGVCVEVSDTGPGMTPEIRARLFTPFFTTKPVGTGTGLGLSICHRIITGLGGTLDCETAPGFGTTFRLWLPPPAARPSSAPAPPIPQASGLQIAVLCDDPLTLQVALKGLRGLYSVITARTVDEAIRLLTGDQESAAILCDASLLRSGDEPLRLCLDACRARRVAVGVLGARGAAGAEPFLAKPFDGRAIQQFVGAMLERFPGGERP